MRKAAPVLMLAVLLLVGCAPSADSHPDRTAPPPPPRPPDPIAETLLSTDYLPGFRAIQESDQRLRIFSRYYDVPGAEALTTAQEEFVRTAWDAYAPVAEAALAAGEESPDLNVVADIAGTASDLVGIRMTTYQHSQSLGSERIQTFWYESGELLQSRDLFRDDQAFAAFGQAVLDEMAAHGVSPSVPEDGTEPHLRSITFENGDPVAEIAEGEFTAAAAGSFRIRVPAGDLLSVAGERAAASVSQPEPFTLGGGATPEPPQPVIVPPPPHAPVDCTRVACVALTYDDGPSAEYTPKLLDALAAAKAPATFFLLGSNVAAHPEVAREIADRGYEIGSHTWTHRDLIKLDASARAKEFRDTSAAIFDATGQSPRLMRPPYGSFNDDVAAEAGATLVLWNVDSEDWSNRDATVTTDNVLKAVRPGAIVLMHDIHPSTVDAAPELIRRLREAGYTLVTVSDILAPLQPAPGDVFYNGAAPR